ncbi:hypothetical protein DPMN_137519 [Dreissena polymorpha]|uniref:Uncharacterized protein n=1 Tax=Dreissena polymorpha TaxID=45954 RepID=A0A9D4G5L6_DREPO|nr:hypothetical protein DPMN_137519 [Dreissena polymorpha]
MISQTVVFLERCSNICHYLVSFIREDEDEEGRSTSRMAVNLTPEMVNAQFVLIDPSTPTDEKVPA